VQIEGKRGREIIEKGIASWEKLDRMLMDYIRCRLDTANIVVVNTLFCEFFQGIGIDCPRAILP
jgi:hypothetical protein